MRWINSAIPLKTLGLGAALLTGLALAGCAANSAGPSGEPDTGLSADRGAAADRLEQVRDDPVRLRRFLESFPKGGDIHNHLVGAIYAETWLDWAAEDGLCIDTDGPALRDPGTESCAAKGLKKADAALENEDLRRRFINGASLRSFVPENGWSGHDQFFRSFNRLAAKPDRLGDMLAVVSRRAARQNTLYLELMHTLVLPELYALVDDVRMTGDPKEDAGRLMASALGAEMERLADSIETQLDAGLARRRDLLDCDTPMPEPGCDVEIRFLHQVLRDQPPAVVYAQMILGWRVIDSHRALVGLNLVAPEDGHIALRDYTQHMKMLAQLRADQGARPLSLHAGELTLGLVRPKNLRFHIGEAIEVAGAQRIGHGVAIPYEDDSAGLLDRMAEDGIAVEINLTSNAVILGVSGDDHPLPLYRAAGVPVTLSTDDEGVSRIDLTHEYMRAVQTFGLSYEELKDISRNALRHAFVDEEARSRLLRALERRFQAFEADYAGS